jgi:predicted amidohydrolase
MGTGKKPVLGGRDAVKVAIVQKAPRFLDKEASLTRAETYIAEAAAGGAELIVFPEVWLAGYPYWTEGWDSPLQAWAGGRIAFRDAAVLAPSEDTERLGAAARQAGAYVVMGCNEIDPRPEVSTIYNSLLFFDRTGHLMGRHRKTMPTFTERLFWGQGDAADFQVFDTDIGRLGGLICGEHLMTLVRAAMIGLGEEIHVAVFPGAFALHTGPSLEEWDGEHASFWGHSSVRAHALEAGAFVLSACGIIDESDVPDEFPHKGRMNIRYARGGSSVIAPLGIPLAGPSEGPQIVYATLEAWMIKAWKSIIDTAGHYSRPDLVRLVVNGQAPSRERVLSYRSFFETISPRLLAEAADAHGVDTSRAEALLEQALKTPALLPGQGPG